MFAQNFNLDVMSYRCIIELIVEVSQSNYSSAIDLCEDVAGVFLIASEQSGFLGRCSSSTFVMVSPGVSSNGPSEFPGLMAASVWMAFGMTCVPSTITRRRSALMTPVGQGLIEADCERRCQARPEDHAKPTLE